MSCPGPLASTEAPRSALAPAGAAAGGPAAPAALSASPRLNAAAIAGIRCRISASLGSFAGALFVVARLFVRRRILASRRVLVAREARKQLIDQAFKHDGRLRELQLAAGMQKRVGAAGREGDVIGAEQAGSLDGCIAVVRNVIVSAVDGQLDRCLVHRNIVADRTDLPYPHAGHRYWCADFQSADIVELRDHSITLRGARKL